MDNDEKGNLCQDIPYLDQLCLFFCLNIFYLFSTNTSTDDSGSFQVQSGSIKKDSKLYEKVHGYEGISIAQLITILILVL